MDFKLKRKLRAYKNIDEMNAATKNIIEDLKKYDCIESNDLREMNKAIDLIFRVKEKISDELIFLDGINL